MGFLPVYTYFIFLSWLVSILSLKKTSPLYLKLFSPFLLVTLLLEIYTNYLSSTGASNIIYYNFFSVAEFCFYVFLITFLVREKKAKKYIWASAVLYVPIALVNIIFLQGPDVFHTTTFAAGGLLLATYCIYFFYELFRVPGTGKLEQDPAFWICTGILFFYCCGFPLFGFVNFWGKTVPLVIENFSHIINVLNIFQYSLFSIAFLCTKTRKYTLLSS